MNIVMQSRSSVKSAAFQDTKTYFSGICFIWIHYNDHHLQRVSWDFY